MSRISSRLRIEFEKSVIEGRLSLLNCGSDFKLKLRLDHYSVLNICDKVAVTKLPEEPGVSVKVVEKE